MCACGRDDVPIAFGRVAYAQTLSIWCICFIWWNSEMVVEKGTGGRDWDRRQAT